MRTIFYLFAIVFVSLSSVNSVNAEVILRYFSADLRGNTVLATWASDYESENQYYTVERSHNGAEFTDIGTVDGSGNSTSYKEYSFTDANPIGGGSWYRIRMIDDQGVLTYSDAVFLEGQTTNPGGTLIMNFPGSIVTYNPFNVKVPKLGNPDITFQIFSIDGKLIHQENLFIEYPTTVTLNVPELKPGMYFLNAFDNQTNISKHFVVTK